MVVDAHCHLFPPAWRAHGHVPADMFEPAALVERHEAAGIRAAVVSDPHIWYGALDPSDIERDPRVQRLRGRARTVTSREALGARDRDPVAR